MEKTLRGEIMDKFDRDFNAELRERISKIEQRLSKPPKIMKPIELTIPKAMEIPYGDIYAVFKRSNKGANHRILMSLPRIESVFWATIFNEREEKKRRALPEMPEEVWFFDCVRKGTYEENVYWNPPEVIQESN